MSVAKQQGSFGLQEEDDHGETHPDDGDRCDGSTELAEVPRSRLLLGQRLVIPPCTYAESIGPKETCSYRNPISRIRTENSKGKDGAEISKTQNKGMVISLDGCKVFRLGETQQTKRDSTADNEPDCSYRRPGGLVDMVPKLGIRQGSVTGKSKGLPT